MSTQTSTQTESVLLEHAALHGDEMIQTPIGDIKLVNTYFDDDTSSRLFDDILHHFRLLGLGPTG
jgi:hypothetical protein